MIEKGREYFPEELQDMKIFETTSPIGREVDRKIIITILSQKGKELGKLDWVDGELTSKNSRLIEVFKNLLREGIYEYDISNGIIVRTLVTVLDGSRYIEALTSQLSLLGFRVDRKEKRYYERSK